MIRKHTELEDDEQVQDSVDSEESSEVSSSDSSDGDDDNGDGDSAMDVEQLSLPCYILAQDVATSLEKDNYVCQMYGSGSLDHIIIASSDFTISVYDGNQFKKLSSFSGHSNTISNIRCCPTEPQQFYSSSTDGTIRLWDIRRPRECVLSLKDDLAESGRLKPFLSFDVSKSGKFLCAGTELFEGDAYLDFWDVRSHKLLGGYWESHSDDVTQVCFHPILVDTVASASTDGLINIFDLSKESEDDALLSCLNSGSTVDILSWHSIGGIMKGLCCVTDTMDVQIWERDGSEPLKSFLRSDISSVMKTNSSDTYVVNLHRSDEGGMCLLAGASDGKSGHEHLVLLDVKEELKLKAIFPANRQRVRCSWFDDKKNCMIAGGESGILSMWQVKTESSETAPSLSELKIKPKMQNSRVKPY